MPFGAAVSKIKPLPLLELAEGLAPEVLLVSDRACRILMDWAGCVNTKKTESGKFNRPYYANNAFFYIVIIARKQFVAVSSVKIKGYIGLRLQLAAV